MTKPELLDQIFTGVQFSPAYEDARKEMLIPRRLGFVTLGGVGARNISPSVRVVAFGNPGWQLATDDLPESYEPKVHLDEIPEALWDINRDGKGVGPRFWSAKEASRGSLEDPKRVGVYLLSPVSLHRIFDARRSYDETLSGKGYRIAQHKLLQLRDRNNDKHRQLINGIHQKQGEVDVAIYNQTVDGRRKEKQRGVRGDITPHQLLIVRSKRVNITKIGEFERAD
jgi:hypothetical protein